MSNTKEETCILGRINEAQVADKYLQLPGTFSQSITLGYYISHHDCGLKKAGIISTSLQNDKYELIFNSPLFLNIKSALFYLSFIPETPT